MRIAGFVFQPRLVPTLVTIMLLPVLISLGFWQLSRMQEKQQIQNEQQKMASAPVLEMTPDTEIDSASAYRQLRVSGQFLPEYTIYVDNKVVNGEVGYEVVMPFRINGSNSAVLVNRGWIRAHATRQTLPKVTTPSGKISLEGVARFNTKDVVSFGSGNRLGKDWPALVRWIDIASLQQDMQFKLKPFLFMQQTDVKDGLVRDWKILNSPPEKNLSYAVQWFALATALLLIYIIVNTRKVRPELDK